MIKYENDFFMNSAGYHYKRCVDTLKYIRMCMFYGHEINKKLTIGNAAKWLNQISVIKYNRGLAICFERNLHKDNANLRNRKERRKIKEQKTIQLLKVLNN